MASRLQQDVTSYASRPQYHVQVSQMPLFAALWKTETVCPPSESVLEDAGFRSEKSLVSEAGIEPATVSLEG